MGLLRSVRTTLTSLINWSYSKGQEYGERRKIVDVRRRKLINNVVLTDAEKKSILNFYKKNYGKKINLDWHRLYQSFTGKFNVEYFPEILFSSKLEPLMNDSDYRRVLDDKLLLSIFVNNIHNVRIPKSFGYIYDGIICNSNNEIINKNDLIKIIRSEKKVIIKPSQDTNSGKGVLLIDNSKMDKHEIMELIDSLDTSVIIQECINQNADISKLNPSSVNTFRVISYILDGKVYISPITLRIGSGDSFLDNAHAGGLFIHVKDEGFLDDFAFTEFQEKYEVHPESNITFCNYKIPLYDKLLETVKKMHLNVPQLGIISWDIAIDDKDNFVLIEANTRGQSVWFPQMCSGQALFGNNTAKMLHKISLGIHK